MAALPLRYGAQRTLSTPPLRSSSRLALGPIRPIHSSVALGGSLLRLQELQQVAVYFFGLFLLDPVACVFDVLDAQAGHQRR